MALEVADEASFDDSHCRLEVNRTFRLTAGTTVWPTQIRFSLPAQATIQALDPYLVEPAQDQKIITLSLSEARSSDQPLAVTFSLPAERLHTGWTLRAASSMLHGVYEYRLQLSFGRPIDRTSWKPSAFLGDATIEEETGNLSLCKTIPSLGPFVADMSVSFHFAPRIYTEAAVAQLLSEMPTLKFLADKHDSVFTGYRIIILLHFLEDLLPFLYSLSSRGLDPRKTLLLYKDYPYAHFDMVSDTLRDRGFVCEGPIGDIDHIKLTKVLSNFCDNGNEPVIVIEDGGYILPVFHRETAMQPHLTRLRGVVEQTTYGARRALEVLSELADGDDARLGAPLINVAQSEVKALYEPWFVAEAACMNIRSLVELSWTATRVVVLGYGAIGRAAFTYLQRSGAHVAVCDPSPLRLVLARNNQAVLIGQTLEEVVAQYNRNNWPVDFIIGTTGYTSVTSNHAKTLGKWHTRLVSMSSKRVEFDLQGFADTATKVEPLRHTDHAIGIRYMFSADEYIDVLANGYPVNFFTASSVPNKHIDPIMGILHACAAELAKPDLLLNKSTCIIVGRRDADYPALPWSRISSEIVDAIIEKEQIFAPMLPMVSASSGGAA